MNELLFALFIFVGFLNGMLLFGHIFYFSLYSFPTTLKVKSGNSPRLTITELAKKIYPTVIWLIVIIVLTYAINKFFTFYIRLFYCGLAISFIFTVGKLPNREK